jgi:hypothetical protein
MSGRGSCLIVMARLVPAIHVWTARRVQGLVAQKLGGGYECGHVSGLSVRSMTAAQMVSASEPSTRLRRHDAPVEGTGYLARGFDQLPCSAIAPSPETASLSGRRRPVPVRLSARHHGPHDTGHLVGQGHRHQLARPALQQAQQPLAGQRWPGLASRTTAVAPSTSNVRNRSLPWREIPPSRVLPPVECCLGVSPVRKASGCAAGCVDAD